MSLTPRGGTAGTTSIGPKTAVFCPFSGGERNKNADTEKYENEEQKLNILYFNLFLLQRRAMPRPKTTVSFSLVPSTSDKHRPDLARPRFEAAKIESISAQISKTSKENVAFCLFLIGLPTFRLSNNTIFYRLHTRRWGESSLSTPRP